MLNSSIIIFIINLYEERLARDLSKNYGITYARSIPLHIFCMLQSKRVRQRWPIDGEIRQYYQFDTRNGLL